MTNAVITSQYASNNPTQRNRIINGAMVIDQRNAGGIISGAASAYCLDRWYYLQDSTNWTIQQSSTVPSGQGFVNSVVMTTTGTKSPSSGTYAGILQQVEGYNMADLGWGASGAQSVTLSFWVNSSKTGIYTATVKNSAGAASYAAEYTIVSANTWQKVTLTIPGPTIGTWLKTNGIGIQVTFWLCGQNAQGSPNTWYAGNINMSTNQVNWFDASGATFYLTGVQLEAGTTATPFEYRQYGTEFSLCQRYFQRRSSETVTYASFGTGGLIGSNVLYQPINTLQTMRAAPSMSSTAANTFRVDPGNVSGTVIAFERITTNGYRINVTTASLTGSSGELHADYTTLAYIDASAEL